MLPIHINSKTPATRVNRLTGEVSCLAFGFDGRHFVFRWQENAIRLSPAFVFIAAVLTTILWFTFGRTDASNAVKTANVPALIVADNEPVITAKASIPFDNNSTPEVVASAPVVDVLAQLKELEANVAKTTNTLALREQFLVDKQLVVSRHLIAHRVARVAQLTDQQLLQLNEEVAQLFTNKVLNKIKVQPHVYDFFTSELPLKKLETALMEQAKFNIPASVKLAQAAVETAYGRKVVGNNFFGIKDKSHQSVARTTVEYYTPAEAKANKHIIVSQKKVYKEGKHLLRCIVKDSFEEYVSPWASFRGHSKFLSENSRYSPLFVKGKDYKAWADKIGSTKYGGVGYATEPIYGTILKKVIERYHLDLLDY